MRKQKYRRLVALIVIGLIVTGGTVLGQEGYIAKVGTVGTKFLQIPVGARGTAMGTAFGPLSDDVTAMFWNPAGLTKIKGTSVMFERVNWLAEIGYNAVGVARKLNESFTVGFFATSLNSGAIDETTIEQPNGTGDTFETSDVMIGVSAATVFTDKFSFGMNIKYVSEDLAGEIANAWAVDVGTLYDTQWNTLRLSMFIRDFGPEINLEGNYFDYNNGATLDEPTEFLPYHFPMTFRLGVAVDPLLTETQRVTVVGELEHPNDNLERFNVGAEWSLQEMFFLRGGYTYNHDTLGLSAGIGAQWQGFGVDYAFSDFSVLNAVHRFNVNFSF